MPDGQDKTAVVVGPREPVTIAIAAELTGRTRKVIEHLITNDLVQPKACLLDGRRTLILELWEVEAAIAKRRPYRRGEQTRKAIGVG